MAFLLLAKIKGLHNIPIGGILLIVETKEEKK